jgi:hypothetical protein
MEQRKIFIIRISILFIALFMIEFGIGYIITNKIMNVNNFNDKICMDPILFIFRIPPFLMSLIFIYPICLLKKKLTLRHFFL